MAEEQVPDRIDAWIQREVFPQAETSEEWHPENVRFSSGGAEKQDDTIP